MLARSFIRVAAVAVGLSTLSFAVGVAGDLSLADPPNYGERVVLRLPPELPADAVRAAPLISTSVAEAAAPLRQTQHFQRFAPISARTIAADYLVNDLEASLAPLPKLRSYWAEKPVPRLTVA